MQRKKGINPKGKPMIVLRFGIVVLAQLFIVTGFFIFWLPIPLGLIMMGTGFGLLLSVNDRARSLMRSARQNCPWFDRFILQAQEKLPERFAKLLSLSDPD